MRKSALVFRSLRFYWRTHVGVVLGTAVAATVLVGALVLGDSVRHTLRWMALARLGRTELAVTPRDRFFRADLADRLAREMDADVAAVLVATGSAARADTDARENRIRVLGVDDAFWRLSSAGRVPDAFARAVADGEGVVVNEALAEKLGLRGGEELLLKVARGGLLSRDAPLSGTSANSVPMRVTVKGIVTAADFGRFDLRANQMSALNVYLPRERLGGAMSLGTKSPDGRDETLAHRANALLAAAKNSKNPSRPLSTDAADRSLGAACRLSDAALELRGLPKRGTIELRTRRVFLDAPVAAAAMKIPHATGILTYLVNEIRHGDKSTPYSMVTAIGGEDGPGLANDETDINSWLARDLGAAKGSKLTLRYYTLGPMRTFIEKSRTFRVRKIIPLTKASADRDLMPRFPNLADTKKCTTWRPGIPIDTTRIHEEDEQYWQDFGGTPKAFISLSAGQDMWRNRFGTLTAVRYPLTPSAEGDVRRQLLADIDPRQIGLFFQPVRSRALKASGEAMDFGQLFLGLSFFLIVSAVILAGLLFAFNIQQRTREVGTLLAVGWTPKQVRRLMLAEGGALAVVGSAIGGPLGLVYTRVLLLGLSSVWSGAVAGSEIRFHTGLAMPLIGAGCAVGVAMAAIWLVVTWQARRPARELLAGGDSRALPVQNRRAVLAAILAVACLLGAAGMLIHDRTSGQSPGVGAFFGAGAMLLIAAIAAVRVVLSRFESARSRRMSLLGLALRNAARRSGRSLAVVALLACGSFMVIAVSANRHAEQPHVTDRSAPTGGFALYAETSIGVLHDMNTTRGRKALNLDTVDLTGVSVVAGRLREGDDASCLNLNRAQLPRLIGLPPEELRSRGAMRFVDTLDGRSAADGWSLLTARAGDDAVPAVTDQGTLMWALKKKLGDVLTYKDERGRDFKVRLVGAIQNSIFQGGIVIAEDEFVAKFPSAAGYRVFLVDAPPSRTGATQAALTKQLSKFGFEAVTTSGRLARFNQVENAYLSIFQVLGALGMLLGSAGMALVVLRNVLQRRGELALMRAVGFPRGRLGLLIVAEHVGLLTMGLIGGAVSALVAVLPSVLSAGRSVPAVSLAVTLLIVALGGVLCTYLAGVLSLRGELLAPLRDE